MSRGGTPWEDLPHKYKIRSSAPLKDESNTLNETQFSVVNPEPEQRTFNAALDIPRIGKSILQGSIVRNHTVYLLGYWLLLYILFAVWDCDWRCVWND